MSAFLGPIHHWLYNKIQIQQSLVEDLIALSNEALPEADLERQLNQRFGLSEKRPLEEVIDQGNIHGWLQSQVSREEYKLAAGVTIILDMKPELAGNIEGLFYQKGSQLAAASKGAGSAAAVYKIISDSLLDGMPCDHANNVVEANEQRVIWTRNTCVHQAYWEEVGGDIRNYYLFREALIKGFISNMPIAFEKLEEATWKLEMNHE